jgi:hypothetical protein
MLWKQPGYGRKEVARYGKHLKTNCDELNRSYGQICVRLDIRIHGSVISNDPKIYRTRRFYPEDMEARPPKMTRYLLCFCLGYIGRQRVQTNRKLAIFSCSLIIPGTHDFSPFQVIIFSDLFVLIVSLSLNHLSQNYQSLVEQISFP